MRLNLICGQGHPIRLTGSLLLCALRCGRRTSSTDRTPWLLSYGGFLLVGVFFVPFLLGVLRAQDFFSILMPASVSIQHFVVINVERQIVKKESSVTASITGALLCISVRQLGLILYFFRSCCSYFLNACC